jgi:hypothetical protein
LRGYGRSQRQSMTRQRIWKIKRREKSRKRNVSSLEARLQTTRMRRWHTSECNILVPLLFCLQIPHFHLSLSLSLSLSLCSHHRHCTRDGDYLASITFFNPSSLENVSVNSHGLSQKDRSGVESFNSCLQRESWSLLPLIARL